MWTWKFSLHQSTFLPSACYISTSKNLYMDQRFICLILGQSPVQQLSLSKQSKNFQVLINVELYILIKWLGFSWLNAMFKLLLLLQFLFLPELALLVPLKVAVFKTISQSFSASASFCIQRVDGCCSPLAMTSWLMILKTVHLPLFEPFEKLPPECYLSWPQQHPLGIPPQSFWARHGKP